MMAMMNDIMEMHWDYPAKERSVLTHIYGTHAFALLYHDPGKGDEYNIFLPLYFTALFLTLYFLTIFRAVISEQKSLCFCSSIWVVFPFIGRIHTFYV